MADDGLIGHAIIFALIGKKISRVPSPHCAVDVRRRASTSSLSRVVFPEAREKARNSAPIFKLAHDIIAIFGGMQMTGAHESHVAWISASGPQF